MLQRKLSNSRKLNNKSVKAFSLEWFLLEIYVARNWETPQGMSRQQFSRTHITSIEMHLFTEVTHLVYCCCYDCCHRQTHHPPSAMKKLIKAIELPTYEGNGNTEKYNRIK